MLEHEISSVMKFVLERSDNPHPYYWSMPQDFIIPSVYFPQPEITSDGATTNHYELSYSWFIKFFAKDVQSAHVMGLAAFTALRSMRNAVPLIDTDGNPAGRVFRLQDPKLRTLDDMTAQLTLTWNSYRPYHRDEIQKMMRFNAKLYLKNAFENAVNQI
jgi:hypothetical protein